MLADALIRLGDDHLILGHRLSEWCGHAPMLEEDLALPNIALDLIGQARALYGYAAEVEGAGRTEDDLAYMRLERDYRNLLITERPNGDFAHTMLRQFYFAAFHVLWWERLTASTDDQLAAIAGKAVKESRYHLRHTGEWVIRLGDGTHESRARMAAAQADLARFTGEFFVSDDVSAKMAEAGLMPDPAKLREPWLASVNPVMAEATLDAVEANARVLGGRKGQHTEAMGYLLADLQYMQRSFPGLTW